MLRKITMLTICFGFLNFAYADLTETNVGCTNAWSGATNDRPEWVDPKDLAESGHLLDATEKALIREWDDDIYTWYEPDPPTDYTWILVTFADDPELEMDFATAAWCFWVDVEHVGDRDPNKFLYYDGMQGKFICIDTCAPDHEYINYVDVTPAFENNGEAENVIFLIYGYTPYSDETWAKCNTVNVTICQYTDG
jgi:hypothetical protein